MKKRIAYISLYFFTVLLIFILQKPLFMLYNGSIEKGFGFADYMQVMVHGASLDAATAGYLTAFPFLLVLISIWFRKFPLKKILYGYYILAAALISIIQFFCCRLLQNRLQVLYYHRTYNEINDYDYHKNSGRYPV